MIGVAGCGRMGLPMLEALVAAGFKAQGLDLVPRVGIRAQVLLDPEAFAAPLTTLYSVVRDVQQSNDLLFDVQAVLAKAPQLETLVICSTLSPRYIAELRARLPQHLALVDAPMSGAQIAARERRLSFMLGGDATDLDRLQPQFAAMGQSFHRMGPLGAGMTAKVLNNILAASSTLLTRLALRQARRAGLEPEAMLALMHASSGQNWLASGFEVIEFAKHGFEPDNTIAILAKDVEAGLDALDPSMERDWLSILPHLLRGLPAYDIDD